MVKNGIFIKAYDWLVDNKGIDGQKGLAEALGISQNTISRIMTCKVEPSDDTLRKMSQTFGFNMQWLRGEEVSMFKESKQTKSEGLIDQSSLMNATLAAQQQTIESLNREIKSLHERLKEKDEYIANLKKQLSRYEHEKILDNYPFPMSVSEPLPEQKKR